MQSELNPEKYTIGVIGLGVMGRNLSINIAGHGFSVAGYDRDPGKVHEAVDQASSLFHANERIVCGAASIKELVGLLKKPRAVLMLVPAGQPVDDVINEILPYLEPDDLIIDGGNSYFKDTDTRSLRLAIQGIQYIGMGISGGESGARNGPSLMPGGPNKAYEKIKPVLRAIAAQYKGEPCVAYLGPGSAGHYVKMVHNGIEYGLMQLLAETYDLMKRGLGMSNDLIASVYHGWNQTELNSYLIEITARIFLKIDERTNGSLLDLIRAEAGQKGTGRWASQEAMELGIPAPNIDAAVAARNLSHLASERDAASGLFDIPRNTYQGQRDKFLQQLQRAYYTGMILTFAQGMAQLHAASQAYGYRLDLEAVVRIWRGGCIIRAALLEDIRRAFNEAPQLSNLQLDPDLRAKVIERQADLRSVVRVAADLGLPVPGLMAALAYFDGYRSAWLPANLIQAQRDYFGAHTYERVDVEGVFHTDWKQDKEDQTWASL